LSDENRRALEDVIVHSPRLQTLKLESMDIPWSFLLRSRSFLESLVLQDACPSTPTLSWSVPLPASKPNDVALRPVRIGRMTASPAEMHRLTGALLHTPDVDRKDIPSFAIDFAHLRGIETTCDNNAATSVLRDVLHRASRLEELTLRTYHGMSSISPFLTYVNAPRSDLAFYFFPSYQKTANP